MYTYHYKDRGYTRRHESRLYNLDGTKAPALLITRYTYQMFYKPATGPRGGKGRKECARSVFYRAGMFYRACNVQVTEGGKWLNSYRPLEGVIWDCHAGTSKKQGVPVVSIELIECIPVSVKDTGGREVWTWGDPIADLEDMLAIPDADRAEVTGEIPTATEAPEVVAEKSDDVTTDETTTTDDMEAARLAWIDATTAQGEQISLLAYAGYGDATWQDIARGAAA